MKRIWILIAGFCLIAIVVGSYLLLRPKPFVPKGIESKLSSVTFIPVSPQVVNQHATVKYNSNLKLLTYKATVFGVNTVISEQPTPESFTDVPEVYQKVLDSWNQYQAFDTAQGTVYLTRPGGPNANEVGVMNTKGTLMFVKPDKNLTNAQWRQVFNSLQISS